MDPNNFFKTQLESLGLSDSHINAIFNMHKVTKLLYELQSTQLTYNGKEYEKLAETSTAINKLYEYSTNTKNKISTLYFKDFYKDWLCLVLETETGQVYAYTKKQFIIAFRGLDVHESSDGLDPKPKYLTSFLKGENKPKLLFFENGISSHCTLDGRHMREEYMDELFTHKVIFTRRLDLKESITLGILGELFDAAAYGIHTKKDISIVDPPQSLFTKKPEIANRIKEQNDTLRALHKAYKPPDE